VATARARALERQGCPNGELTGEALDRHAAPGPAAARFLQTSALRLGWSARSFHRVLRCARTVADLAAAREIETPHIAEAVQLRRAL
jgi:magnesium chelatase family protein